MIGDFRHRLIFERNDGVTDAGGGQAESWTTVATVWARLDASSHGGTNHAGRGAERIATTFTIRYRTDIAAGMRATFEGEVFRVQTLFDPDHRKRYLTLECVREAGR